MKKFSYNSRPEKKIKVEKNLPAIQIGDDSYTENASRYGYIMPGDLYPVTSGNPPELFQSKNLEKVLIDLKKQNITKEESDFVDFLITKNAESNSISYEKLFLEYIYKIYTSDLLNSDEKIKKINFKFSILIKQNLKSGLALKKSKELAYKKIIQDTEILKTAQVIETDPKFVAEYVAKIILIMISKFSMESRSKARANLKRRISNLNVQDISNKKTPAGAAIGTSIALVKNILNGKDGFFIKTVMDELQKYI